MSWNFLRIVSNSDKADMARGGHDEASALMLDLDKLGVARESLNDNLVAFEQALLGVSRLPDQFRMVMAPIEAAVANLGLLRRQLAAAETQLSSESQRAAGLQQDAQRLADTAERLQRELVVERTSGAAVRQRVLNLDAENARQVQIYEDLVAQHQRTEAELVAATGQLQSIGQQLADVGVAYAAAEQRIVSLEADLDLARSDLAARETMLAALTLADNQQRGRLDRATQTIAELETEVRQSDERYNDVSAALHREREAAIANRTELNRARQALIEAMARLESHVEVAQSQGKAQDQRIEAMRARLTEAEHALAVERRERRDREIDMTRLKSAQEAMQRRSSELRTQLASVTEANSILNRKLHEEIDRCRALEAQLDATREQAAASHVDHQTALAGWHGAESNLTDVIHRLRQRLAEVESDNEQLRASKKVMATAQEPRRAVPA